MVIGRQMMSEPPSRLLLDGDALVANWRWLARQNGAARCGAAIKADGYGVGAAEVLKRLAAAGCRDFFVATWDEARALGPLPDGASLSVSSEERRVGKEWVSTCRFRWSPYHSNKNP